MIIQSRELKKLILICFGNTNNYLNKKIIRDSNNKENFLELLFDKEWFYK